MNYRLLFTLILFIPLFLSAQGNDEQIEKIRKWYKKTESDLSKYKHIEVTNGWYDEETYSGDIPEYNLYIDPKSDQIVKITEYEAWDWAEITTSYYFNDGELYFIFVKGYTPGEMYTAEELGMSDEKYWESGGEAKTLNLFEERYYFDGENIIRSLKKDQSVSVEENNDDLSAVSNEEIKMEESEIQGFLKHYKKMLAAFAQEK